MDEQQQLALGPRDALEPFIGAVTLATGAFQRSAEPYSQHAIATTGFCYLYYRLMGRQRGVKYRLLQQGIDRYRAQHPEQLAADRCFANLHEQSVPFLAMLWLNAFTVDTRRSYRISSGLLGCLWVFFRSLYPMMLGKQVGKTQTKRVYVATLPAYFCVWHMAARLLSSHVGGRVLWPATFTPLLCLLL
jgi:hypothetical protein